MNSHISSAADSVDRLPRKARIGLAAAAGLAALTAALAAPQIASASATGCTHYDYSPAAFCGSVVGSGTYVQKMGASFLAAGLWGWVCNARVRFDFINTYGHTYLTYYTGLESGCNSVGSWGIWVNRWVSRGTLRFTLLSNGATVSVVQERIG
jgi:hypothetical protein